MLLILKYFNKLHSSVPYVSFAVVIIVSYSLHSRPTIRIVCRRCQVDASIQLIKKLSMMLITLVRFAVVFGWVASVDIHTQLFVMMTFGSVAGLLAMADRRERGWLIRWHMASSWVMMQADLRIGHLSIATAFDILMKMMKKQTYYDSVNMNNRWSSYHPCCFTFDTFKQRPLL